MQGQTIFGIFLQIIEFSLYVATSTGRQQHRHEFQSKSLDRLRAARTGHLGREIDSSNKDLNFSVVRYSDNKDIIFLRFMVLSIGQRNGAVFSFSHLLAQALPPADHNKNIHISSP